MKDKVFVDTNIFIYAYSDDNALKHKAAKNLLQNKLAEDFVVVSTQILNEFYSVMSKSKLPHQEIANYVKEIAKQTYIKSVTIESIELCLDIKEKYRFSWWDSLVLTSALENECSVLYSEDLQHGQIIEHSLKIINPFA
jgi:predicted nucleic acid-binding protein